MNDRHSISLSVNGKRYRAEVEPRLLLSDFLRHHLQLTGTHVGCEHGVCGACSVLFNGRVLRSCLMFAIQADGAELMTVEGLSALPESAGQLHPLQAAFRDHHALQCGFCTPGFLMSAYAFLKETPNATLLSNDEIRAALAGNLCRCTGYQGIVQAVRQAAQVLNGGAGEGGAHE